MFGIGRRSQDGMVVIGVEAKHDAAAGWFFDAQALRADGDTAIDSDFEGSAHAPHINPPGAARCRAEGGAFFFSGLVPGPLRRLPQFAMNFMGVAVSAQSVDVRVGRLNFPDFFTGEIGREPALPELVFTLDFAFGLGRRGIAQTDVVELKGPAQLGQGLWVMGEKEAVVIDVELERPSVSQKSCGQEVEIGEQQFPFVEFGTSKEAAAIIEHIEHGPGEFGVGKPAVGRGVQLPEFANAVALPAAHGSRDFLGRDGMGQMVGQRPAADLGAVELEVVQAQGF